MRRIAKQEGRHIDFYASEATRRLENRRAQRITRWALSRGWTPVGSGVMPEPETAHLITYLFGDGEGAEMARRIDRRIDRLPGLAGLVLVDRARRDYARKEPVDDVQSAAWSGHDPPPPGRARRQ